jgi:hypothetical protein
MQQNSRLPVLVRVLEELAEDNIYLLISCALSSCSEVEARQNYSLTFNPNTTACKPSSDITACRSSTKTPACKPSTHMTALRVSADSCLRRAAAASGVSLASDSSSAS